MNAKEMCRRFLQGGNSGLAYTIAIYKIIKIKIDNNISKLIVKKF
jgi:hypothetical protein